MTATLVLAGGVAVVDNGLVVEKVVAVPLLAAPAIIRSLMFDAVLWSRTLPLGRPRLLRAGDDDSDDDDDDDDDDDHDNGDDDKDDDDDDDTWLGAGVPSSPSKHKVSRQR